MLVDESYNGGQCLISLSEGRPRHEGNETAFIFHFRGTNWSNSCVLMSEQTCKFAQLFW